MTTSLTTNSNQLIIIDSQVTDWQSLVGNLSPDATILILDSTRDGISQIAELVANYSNLDAIHIISHGGAGNLLLGSSTLNNDNITDYASQLASIGNALSANGDILLYGCNVAQGDSGIAFIDKLGLFTGADVAASDNLTGSAVQGGDWILEQQTGVIEASLPITDAVLANYAYTLASNSAPIAHPDTLTATEDTAITYTALQLLGNDTDANGDPLTIGSVTSFTGGIAVLNANGTVTFTPTANFNGVANFIYQANDGTSNSNVAVVTVNVAAVNDAPVANPDTLIAVEDTTITYTAAQLLGNDTDIDGNSLTIASVTNGTGGTVVLNADGTVTFTPTANFNGAANFTYQANDGTVNSNSAPVTVNVFSVNDAPVANPDTLTTTEDTAITYTALQLLGNDTDVDGDPLTIASVANGVGGTVVLNADGTVTFTPTANFNGAANFTYQASDGTSGSNSATVTVNVSAVNDAPVAVNDILAATEDTAINYSAAQLLGNDTDVDGNPLTIASVANGTGGTVVLNADGSVTFIPTLNFNGAANFTYLVNDGTVNSSNSATVTVNVAAVNDAPVANDDILAATEDTAITYTAAQLTGNDIDVDGNPLTIASVANGTGGTVVLNADGTVTFTPTANFNGAANFTYHANDGTVNSNSATVTVNVAAVNDAPVANPDTLTATEDTAINYTALQLLGNDIDVDGNPLTIASVANGIGGTVVLNADGSVTFTPDLNFNGAANFTYQANDGTVNSNSATVTVNVAAVNDAPLAVNDILVATEDTVITYTAAQLLGNDTDVDGNPLTIASVANGTGGTVVLNADGSVTFTPALNFNGAANFTYQASDGATTSNSATVTVNVAVVNDAPVAVNDVLVATEDTVITYTAAQLLSNDTDVDFDTLTIASVTSGTGGIAVLNADGTVTFTPTANFNGAATFTYQARDGSLLNSNSATVTVNVAAVNDVPVAVNDILAATEDTVITYTASQLLGNDTDVEGNPLTIASVANGTGGTVVLNADGSVTFTPTLNFNGVANFTYQANDGTVNSNSATVTVNVAAVNDAPVANNDTLIATEDNAITYTALQLLGNDTDVEGNPLTITSVANGTGGTVVLNADGTVTFTPTLNFNGAATFTYHANDGTVNSNSATVTVNVAAVNDAPVAVNDILAATEDTVITYTAAQLLGNDIDIDGNPLTIASVANGIGGTVVLNADGSVTFTPTANFNGAANFTYQANDGTVNSNSATVTVNVAAVNDAPVAVNDILTATEDTAITYTALQLLGNDTDVDGNPLTIASVANGTGGTVVLNADGSVTFTPDLNFNGAANFTYHVNDGSVNSNSAATVTVNVAAVNDAPVANNDTLIATEDTAITYTALQLLGNDTDVDGNPLTIVSVANGIGGTVVLNADGSVTFTPTLNFNGAANFTYQASDGTVNSNSATVTVNVAAVNDAPVAVNDIVAAIEDTAITYTALQLLGNDTDVDGNPLTIVSVANGTGGTVLLNADGSVTFTPTLNFNGAAHFTYQASDGGLISNSATVTVNVAAVNDAPIAVNDILTATEDTAITYTALQLLGNDTDIDGNPLTIASVTNGTGGTVVLNTDGSVTFTPTLNFNGAANFTYQANDGTVNSNSATVTVNVAAVNDAPVAVNDIVAATEDTAITYTALQLLGNDTDVDGNPLTIASVANGIGGTVVLNADGTVTFTPTLNFNGAANFTYHANDGTVNSNSATVTVNVAAVNDAPVANNDTLIATEDTAITYTALQLLGNDTDVEGNPLTIASVANGTGGTVVLNADGSVTFTPTANFNGVANFTYQANDGTSNSNSATVTVNVAAVNDAPVANNDTLIATEDTAITYTALQLLGNDTDVDGNPLTIASVANGTGGTVVLNADGSVTFTPDLNFNGAANFTYHANDGTVNSNSATVTVNVAAVNDAPVANHDTLTATEDTAINYTALQLLGNDTDVDGNPLTIASVANGIGGTVVLNADGSVTFTPNANFNGAANFTYQANDGTVNSNSATVTVNVAAVNDAPVAVNDILAATEDTAITYTTLQLLGNDTDIEGNPLTIASVANGTGGTVVLNANGTVTFTPTANFNGVANFTYQANDGTVNSNSATVTVNVAAVNDAPVAVNDILAATEDTAITYTALQLLGNDTDVDGNPLTIASVANGIGGTVVLNADGSVTFTPTLNFNGVANFTYQANDGTVNSNSATVTVNVAAVNDAPVANNDTLTATEDTAITYTALQLLGNDTDVDGNPLTIVSVSNGTGGTVVLNADGSVTFTSALNFNGAANFTYIASDGVATSNSATVTVNVVAVNDAPVANNDTLAATEDTAITYTAAQLLGNDTDVDFGDTLTIASVTSGTGGIAVLNADGTVTFTPTANFNGVASFTYQARDGSLLISNSATVTVNVAAVNDAPVAVNDIVAATEDTAITYTALQLLGNDTDVDGNPLTIASVANGTGGTVLLNADGTVTFTPTANFNGVANFTYQANDGTVNSNSATVTVNVAAVNDAPVANNDTLIATEDNAVTYTAAQLLGNDTDVDGNPLTIASVANGTGGTVVLNANGTVTFTPDLNFNGAANFTYQASDGAATSNSATVNVNVFPINDAPVANNDILAATEDTAITYTALQLLGNDIDVDGNPLTIASVANGTGGTVVLNADGTVTFTPTPNFNGAANFTYHANDGTVNSNSATVTVNVAAVNDAPVAVNDTLAATEDTAIIYTALQLLGNDTDVEGNPLTIASVANGTGGTVVLNANGTVTFTPTANFNGVANFTYQTSDGVATSNSATVTVNVAAVNDAPVANADILAATEDTSITYTALQLLGNDTDVDGNPLTIASVANGTGGTVVLNADGSVTFTPTLNFNGVANFTYQANDGTVNSNSATVTVNVAAVNDAPVAVNDTLTAVEDTVITYTALQLLGNDTDIEGNPLTIASVANGTGGTVVLNADGSVTFTPNLNFNGAANFTYQANDGTVNSNSATVIVNVAAVNDAPVAVNDTLTAVEDTVITYTALQLLGNDTDIDGNPLTIASVTSGTGGLAVLNADGSVTFTPTANFNGAANFTYIANDGGLTSNSATVTVNVAAVNDAPVAVNDILAATEDTAITYTALQLLGNDTDIDFGDTLTIASVTSGTGGIAVLNADGTVTFTPTANFNGAANFTYQAKDGALLTSNSATVTVNVAAVNDAPVAHPDTLTATEDTAITYTALQLLGNDTDIDGNPLTIAAVTSITGGAVVLNADGTVTFTPTANFNGVANFTYQANDGTSNSNIAVVTVNVAAVNDAPIANNDTLIAIEDTAIIYTAAQLLGNDTDVDGNPLTIASVASGTGGTVVLNANGTVTFTPDLNFNGAANFTYHANDGTVNSNSATVTVNVFPVNDAPIANNDILAATEDTAITYTALQLLGNDTDVDGNPLTIVAVANGTGGTVVLNADGTVTFTPTLNFNGAANFTYQASDGTSDSNSATVTVNVAAVNDAPVAVNDILFTTEDTAINYTASQLLGNDTDVDGNPLTIASVANGIGGTVRLNANGTVTFTPTLNFNGAASFTYQASDGTATSNSATVTVNVAAVNDAPVAVNDILAATEDTPITYTALQLLGNDIDVDGNPLTIASVANGTGGTVVLNADGTVTFTPTLNFNGTANFTYQANDGTVNSNSATVTVNVAAVNDAPVAVNDILVATEDTPITYTALQLLGNDTDVDGNPLTIASVANGTGGTVVLNADGTVTFTPTLNFNGTANFTYQANDGTVNSNSATVTVNVAAVNDAPVAINDTLTAVEDIAITYTAAQLLGNDTDVDGNPLTIASVANGIGGTVVLNADGTVTFTSALNFNGAANFTYQASDGGLSSNSATVTVNVAVVNDAPVAVNDTLIATEDTSVTYTAAQLLGNDTDVDFDILTIASVTSGTGGVAVLNADGSVTFTPTANFNGAANFTYIARDGSLLDSNSATVTVNVAAVNDAPIAVNDIVAATEDTAITYTALQLLGNDTDVDGNPLTIASVANGTGGTVVLNADGSVTFTPTLNFNGAANFTYIANDGTVNSNSAAVTVNVAAVNDAPVAVNDILIATEDNTITYTALQLLGNDTDVEGNPLTIASVANGTGGTVVLNANGTVTFTPTLNFNGVANFTYQANDGTSNSNSATVTVNVAAVNDAPVAVNDILAATEDTAITYTALQLLGNDTDVEGNPLTIASVANGTGGTVVLNADGTVTFTPTLNFNGAANFTYQANDGGLTGNSATVTVNVAAVNDAPVANNDTLAATEDTVITYTALQLLGNDTDVDGNPLTIVSVTNGTGGTVVLNADGTVTFTPTLNFNGAANFTYIASDSTANSNSATVTVNVASVNDAPIANDDIVAATEDTAITYTALQLLGNDTDVDGNPLTIVSVTNGTGGTVVLNADGSVTFTPTLNFNGVANFTYRANDGTVNSNSAAVTINVAAVNDAPVAVNDILTATEDTVITYTALQLLGNDTDVEGNHLTIASVANGTGGTVVLNADGSVTFTPTLNFNGAANFTYQATDNTSNSNSATVTVNVAAVNDAPVAVNDILTATEDTVIIYTALQLLGNDTDVEGNPLTIASVTNGTGGTAVLNANGTVTFTPTANFNGAANFTYQAKDSTLTSNSATVTVNVAPVNDAPVLATPATINYIDTAFVDNFTTVTGSLVASDVDLGTIFTYGITGGLAGVVPGTVTASNAYGVLTVTTATGAYSFVPNSAAIEPLITNVTTTFTVTVSDTLLSANKTLTIAITQDGITESIGGDNLTGTTGADTWAGLAGNDVYYVDNTGDVVIENAGEGHDVINSTVSYTLSGNVEGLVLTGTAAINATGNTLDNILYGNTANNILDGLTGADSMSGSTGDDTYFVENAGDTVIELVGEGFDTVYSSINYVLAANVEALFLTGTANINGFGNSQSNYLAGNSGNNTLDGLVGADAMLGGAGNDSYGVDNAGDVVTENVGEGFDTVFSTIGYVLTTNVEALILTGTAAIDGYGNALDNQLTGNSANNVLVGNAGADTMTGGAGDDTYYVENLGDTVIENAGEGHDVVYSTISYTLSANVEGLVLLGTAAIDATGNAGNNILYGNTASNVLDGLAGTDTMQGGAGDDVYRVDNLGDVIVENANEGWDSIYSTINYVLGAANVEGLFLAGTADINGFGNADSNYLAGNSGNNTLDGLTGADAMLGGAGNDTYGVDNTGDVVIENASEGFDTVYSSINYFLTNNVEALVLTGTATEGYGNSLDNQLTGNSGNNLLFGAAGADTMTGGAGNDTYYIDNTGDTIIENSGEGFDVAFSTASSYTLNANVEQLFLTGTANINATGNAENNYIVGNSGNNILTGGEGTDTLIGGLGQDTYNLAETTAATDTLRIATGDSLVGLASHDTVNNFKLGTGLVNTVGVDRLDLDTTSISANAAAVNGTNSGSILSHSISSGIISFDDVDSYVAPLTITAADLTNVFGYLQANITAGNTVAFISEGNTYVFQDGGTTDTVVELVGVMASSVNTTGLATDSVWII